MKKWVVIGIIAAVAVAAVSAWFFFFNGGMSKEKILADPSEAVRFCAESPLDKRDDCYFYVADVLSSNNESALGGSACMGISDENNKKGCLEMAAGRASSPLEGIEICNNLRDDTKFREHCYGAIYANVGGVDREAELVMCDSKQGSDRDNCYRGIAEEYLITNATKSVEICGKISDASDRDSCFNAIALTAEVVRAQPDVAVSACDAMTLKSRCYSDVARILSGSDSKGAVEVCKKAADEVQISDCYGTVWFYSDTLVINNYDFSISMCSVLSTMKDNCLNKIVVAFMDVDRSKAKAVCNLMSSAAASSCLRNVG